MGNIQKWDPEDTEFWKKEGKKVANRNLWISILCLLCAFTVWTYWSVIIVQMKNLDFPFTEVQLFTLPAIAGLMGATLRIPNSFLIALSGGRNTIFLTTVLLIIPSLGVGIALQDKTTSYMTFVIMAALSGIGGGNFASSMSNISYFFPKKSQGTSLGLNAGLGNFGVSIMQILSPFVMMFALFGVWGGAGQISKIAGELVYIQNAALLWVPILVIASIFSWFGMNNLPTASPNLGSIFSSFLKILFLLIVGFFVGGIGLYLFLILNISKWIVLPVVIVLTVLLMKLIPGKIKTNLKQQFVIFKNKHNWVMTYLYTMTFGSFIGFSVAFPLLISVVFGNLPDGTPNPNAPNPFVYAWLGPFVGSLVRPVGGWLSDKLGGAKVTHWNTVVMILAVVGVGYCIKLAEKNPVSNFYFFVFLILFLILFIATGVGNGSTFRMVPNIFKAKEAGPVLGWISAVAAYGAFLIPRIIGEQAQGKHIEYALYGFAVYYFSCLILNWYYYKRKNAEIHC